MSPFPESSSASRYFHFTPKLHQQMFIDGMTAFTLELYQVDCKTVASFSYKVPSKLTVAEFSRCFAIISFCASTPYAPRVHNRQQ
jgi:hypothetical protein